MAFWDWLEVVCHVYVGYGVRLGGVVAIRFGLRVFVVRVVEKRGGHHMRRCIPNLVGTELVEVRPMMLLLDWIGSTLVVR